MNVNININ